MRTTFEKIASISVVHGYFNATSTPIEIGPIRPDQTLKYRSTEQGIEIFAPIGSKPARLNKALFALRPRDPAIWTITDILARNSGRVMFASFSGSTEHHPIDADLYKLTALIEALAPGGLITQDRPEPDPKTRDLADTLMAELKGTIGILEVSHAAEGAPLVAQLHLEPTQAYWVYRVSNAPDTSELLIKTDGSVEFVEVAPETTWDGRNERVFRSTSTIAQLARPTLHPSLWIDGNEAIAILPSPSSTGIKLATSSSGNASFEADIHVNLQGHSPRKVE